MHFQVASGRNIKDVLSVHVTQKFRFQLVSPGFDVRERQEFAEVTIQQVEEAEIEKTQNVV